MVWAKHRVARVKLRRVLHHIPRGLGLLSVTARVGGARRQPRINQWLRQLGVLEGDTREAVDSALIDNLPWGKRTVQAPKPRTPTGQHGMWPQASLLRADLYPAVLHLDRRELDDHVRYTALRYLGQILTLTPGAAWRARQGARVWPLDDRKFCEILTETSLAQHLCPTLNEADLAVFSPFIVGELGDYAKIDFTGMPPEQTLPGVWLPPTVTLFRRGPDGRYRVLAIRLRDRVFQPSDGRAWTLARYFVLGATHVQHTIIVHPRLHFPSDVLNAISKTVLPAAHPLARLLLPHTRFSLGLNLAVSHHRRSVLHNSQREIYTPLPLTTEGVSAMVHLGRVGMPGNDHAYPAYDFWGPGHNLHTRFGRYCQDWQDAFERFATAATREIPASDPAVVKWADAISEWVPGFPSGAQIFAGDLLGRAVGRYLACVSMQHSADHYSYSSIPIEYLPMRMRVAPPDEAPPPEPLELDRLTHAEDYFRHQLCHRMFFAPTVIESLDELRYTFETPAARAAARAFKAAQRQLDARWAGSGLV